MAARFDRLLTVASVAAFLGLGAAYLHESRQADQVDRSIMETRDYLAETRAQCERLPSKPECQSIADIEARARALDRMRVVHVQRARRWAYSAIATPLALWGLSALLGWIAARRRGPDTG